MKQYRVKLQGKDFISILYRGSYIVLKQGEVFDEDAPVRRYFPKYFELVKEEVVLKKEPIITKSKKKKVEAPIVENVIEEDTTISEDINIIEEDADRDVIIETN